MDVAALILSGALVLCYLSKRPPRGAAMAAVAFLLVGLLANDAAIPLIALMVLTLLRPLSHRRQFGLAISVGWGLLVASFIGYALQRVDLSHGLLVAAAVLGTTPLWIPNR